MSRILSKFLVGMFGCLLPIASAIAGDVVAENLQARYAGAAAGNWAQPGNLVGPADDNCANMGAQQKVNTAFNFSFSIPLTGEIVSVTAHTKTGEQGDQNIQLQLASDASSETPTLIGSPITHLVLGVGNGACSSTTETGNDVGGALANWGTNDTEVTPSVVNDPNFGLVYTTIENSSIKVDSICMEVVYIDEGAVTDVACFEEPQTEGNSITVVKEVVGEVPGSDWDFTGDLAPFSLPAIGGFRTFEELATGTYGISETLKGGYAVSSECFIDGVSETTGDDAISVTLSEGEDATCIFTNTRSRRFLVFKEYDDGSTDAVQVSLACSSGMVTNSPQPASPAVPAAFIVEAFDPGTTCTATETVPDGYNWVNPETCEDVGLEDPGACRLVNERIPVFHVIVQKDFNDDNTAGVPIYIECTTGLPISSDATLYEFHDIFDQIEFIVDAYDPGELDCTIYEDVPEGYQPSYSAGYGDDGEANVDPTNDAGGCHFEEVVGGHFTCDITNSLDQVPVTVDKVWIDSLAAENGAFLFAGAKWRCEPVADLNDISGEPYKGNLTFHGTASDPWDFDTFWFYPHYEGSFCSIMELELDSDILSDDSDCQDLEIFPGYDLGLEEGTDVPVESCTIINTRIYAGIPTLSQYGLALLALLMLGVGFVGYRRFA